MLPQISRYTKRCNKSKCISFLKNIDGSLKTIIKSGIKSTILLKKDLIVNQYKIKNI